MTPSELADRLDSDQTEDPHTLLSRRDRQLLSAALRLSEAEDAIESAFRVDRQAALELYPPFVAALAAYRLARGSA